MSVLPSVRTTGAGKGRFLIVEDEALVANALLRGIQRRGLGECVVAATAAAARQHLKDGASFTALIIDITLDDGPEGLDVLAEARTGAHALAPALVLSGSNDRDDINRALELDAKYMVKPVEMDKLSAFLQEALSPVRKLEIAIHYRHLTGALAQVVKLSALGKTREAIAEARGTSVKTVENQAAKAAEQAGEQSFHTLVEGVLRDVARSR